MTGAYPGVKAGNITFTTNDADEGTVNISVSGEVLNYRFLDDQTPGSYTDVGMAHENNPVGYLGDNSYANTSAIQGPASATWTFGNVSPGIYYVALSWFETGGSTLWASNTQLIVQDGGQEVGNLRFSQQNGPSGSLSFPLDGVNWQILHFFEVDSPTVTVKITNDNVDGLVLADGVLLVRIGGDIPPGNGVSAGEGGGASNESSLPSSDALRQQSPQVTAVDEALLNTVYWHDEPDELLQLLADQPANDSFDDMAAGRRRVGERERRNNDLHSSTLIESDSTVEDQRRLVFLPFASMT
jgi:hypothetical protein